MSMQDPKMTIDNHLASSAGGKTHPAHLLNRTWWDEVTPIHAASDFYDVPGFLNGKPALDRLELDWLGDVAGKRVLHLQCHFGKSTIEIARRDAAQVVGLDFSSVAIATARELAAKAGVAERVQFVECDVLLADRVLDEKFDVIFTSYGVINWLSDLYVWAGVIAKLLAPHGRFVIVEIHPALMMFDWENGKLERKFGYFHCEEGVAMPPMPDYADQSYIPQAPTREWQWSLADVFRALTRAGLLVEQFEEYPTCCFKPYPHMVEAGPDMFRLPESEPELPMTFALDAIHRTVR